jgi:hypothetical protein
MIVKRSDSEPFNSNPVTFIWSSDGWCYDTTHNIRRRFFAKGELFEVFEERGVFVITDIQHQETLGYREISKHPRQWQEGSDIFCVIEENS